MKLEGQALVDYLNDKIIQNTLMQTLHISFVKAEGNTLTAQMPVNSSVYQPMGLLHGGATAALAESVGSTASHIFVDLESQEIRGLELSINHLRSKKEGVIYATAKPIHIGRTTHLWEISIVDENDKMVAHAKITNIVLQKSSK
jgi:uncharacterized protein (TIGR00369 family)